MSGIAAGIASGVAKSISNSFNKSGSSGGSSSSKTNSSGSSLSGTNYHQDAIDAAKIGDWDAVLQALTNREQKTSVTGQDYGKSSTEIYKELLDQYYTQPKFEYPEAPEYGGSRYDDSLQQIIDQLTNQSYEDWTKGDQYTALADRYGQNGEMAMRDILAQISARTGGLASSYAQSAAQQQYNDYMAKLEEAARQMYDAERSEGLDNAQMLAQLAQQDYARYQDELAQWNADRTFSWNQSQSEREWQYQQNRDAIEDQRYDQQYADSQKESEQAAALEKAETLAAYGDFSGYKALGYTDAQINLMQAAYQSKLAVQQASKSSSGGSVSSGSEDYDGLFQAASQSISPQNFISSNYKRYGFSSSSGLSAAYEKWAANGSGSPSLDYSEDEGVFRFNGKQYTNLNSLAAAIDSMNLTDGQKDAIARKLSLYGFDIYF